MSDFFDIVLENDMDLSVDYPHCLAQLIFEVQEQRNENADIILSHIGNYYKEINLPKFRYILFELYKHFKDKGLAAGDTVLLASIAGNNELYIALLFAALTSYGIRVLLPMFVEVSDVQEWIQQTHCKCIVLPESEINGLHQHDNEKKQVKSLKGIANELGLLILDINKDLKLNELIDEEPDDTDYTCSPIYVEIKEKTSLKTEALLITTSGSSGKSKLIHYNQQGFIFNCLSWQQAGFYNHNVMGGRCFTPMFNHTMGIRSFFNAIWTGNPICIINTEWFVEKPEIVRYFLLQMKPEHITGGPSVYKLFLELMRFFPELKEVLSKSFKTLISSGARIDENTIQEIESAFGIKIHNALGTTETQQVLNTLLHKNDSLKYRESLGAPLPGVKLGLKKIEGSKDEYELFLKSKFGMSCISDDAFDDSVPPVGYFETGDVVSLKTDNLIYYEGRKKSDFIKDGFGVKIPIKVLYGYYQPLESVSKHIEFFPIKGIAGLAALLFIDENKLERGKVVEKRIIDKYSARITEINNRLSSTLEPFEFRHRTIIRFVLINDIVPATVKGNVSRFLLRKHYSKEISSLTEIFTNGEIINFVKNKEEQVTSFSYYHNPRMGEMLKALGMDYTYHRAKKDSLFTMKNDEEVEILDFTGGFGTNLLGHNNSQLKETLSDFISHDQIPLSDQGSIQRPIGELAQKLNDIVGKSTGKVFNVLFGSTGSEAVELALHHAYLEWVNQFDKIKENQYRQFGAEAGSLLSEIWDENYTIIKETKPSFISLKEGFHGHTLGSRNFLGNNKKRQKFSAILGFNTIFIDDKAEDWKERLEEAIGVYTIQLKQIVYRNKELIVEKFAFDSVVGAIAEPIVGEGGIRCVDYNVLQQLSEYSFPLIIDEIQSGLGRSGSFLASEGIKGDYYLFAKALGGNYQKISAVLIDKQHYYEKFTDYYSSTFANSGLAASMAIATLDIIEKEYLADKCTEKGAFIQSELDKLRHRYPEIIQKIEGKGLMQGIWFCDFSKQSNFLLRCFYNEKNLGLLFSSYLLNRFNIRILPSLSAPNVLRVEPSAYITNEEVLKLVEAFDQLCNDIRENNMYSLVKSLMSDDPFLDNKGMIVSDFLNTEIEEPAEGAEKVAMIAHFVHPTLELRNLGEEYCKASDTGLWLLFNKLQVLMQMKPVVLFSKNILKNKIHFSLILLPVDSAILEKYYRQNKQSEIIKHVQKCVDLAVSLGIKTISLGAYTSIISNNGLSLVNSNDIKIITGNTLTAACGIKRIVETIHAMKMNKEIRGAIIGAAGNIGSIITERLVGEDINWEEIILLGRNQNKLNQLLGDLKTELNDNVDKVRIGVGMDELKNCNLIITASNTNDPLVYPHHVSNNEKIVICDVSVPSAISEDVQIMENVTYLSFGSRITLPGEKDFFMGSKTAKGTIYCCGAEAILNGLEPIQSSLIGKISREGVEEVTRLARKYHFFDKIEDAETFKTT
nr:aminotransferase class III-fold pyridoxal phosphate-dependent enzyme [uncultured Carboxylicivirga sp.]